VRIFAWLFGKKEKPSPPSPPERQGPPAPSGHEGPAAADDPGHSGPANLPAENLRRWQESGQARAWVEAHHGLWGHDDWLALLDELKRSPFWPMQPEEIGLVLEDQKRAWLGRN
jgi:hypothetical protein